MVKEQIITIFNENKKRYGYRRITQELHNNDICVNHKTVQKLMKQLGLVCQVRAKRKYNSYKGEVGEVAPNLLERHFKTNQPNRKWVTDVTEFKVNDQKLYLSPILDLFNGEVVSYNLSRHPNFKQITDMLEGAFQKLPNKVDNLILHSDQGWQYQMKSYQNLRKAKGITQSMSRKATCLDNAAAEDDGGAAARCLCAVPAREYGKREVRPRTHPEHRPQSCDRLLRGRRPHNRKGPVMTKLRKLAGWLPAVGAMIFNGCVIGWLHCTKPQLLGSSVPGNVIAVGYTILFLLW